MSDCCLPDPFCCYQSKSAFLVWFSVVVSEILIATSAIRPRADVAYCIHALARRLSKTRNWTVRFLFFFPVKFAIFLGVRLLYLDDIFCLRNFVGSFSYPQFYIGYVLLLLVCGFSLMPIFISIGFCYVRYLQWYFKCDNPQVILQYANFFSWFLIYHLKGYFHFCEIGSAFGKFNFHL